MGVVEMAPVTHGADTAALRSTGSQLVTLAGRMREVESSGTGMIEVLAGSWAGPDLDRMSVDWQHARGQIVAAGDALGAFGRRLQEEAQQQDDGSAAHAGAAAPHGVSAASAASPLAATVAAALPPPTDAGPDDHAREAEGARQDRGRTSVDRRGSSGEGSDGTDGGSPPPKGLGEPVPGTDLDEQPEPPKWSPPDEGAGEYDSEWASPKDFATKYAAEAGALALAGAWPDASRNLQHFLGNSGDPLEQDVDAMLEDVESFQAQVDTQTDQLAQEAVDQARADGITEPVTYPVNTPWAGHYLGEDESKNWFFATGGMSYNQTGQITVYPPETPGGPYRYETERTVNYRDQYNWDKGKGVDILGIEVTDAQLAELHRAGLAREYTMYGNSSPQTTSGEVS